MLFLLPEGWYNEKQDYNTKKTFMVWTAYSELIELIAIDKSTITNGTIADIRLMKGKLT